MWQIDATRILLVDDTESLAVNLLDDHSRYLPASLAGPPAAENLAWDAFELAATRQVLGHEVSANPGRSARRHSPAAPDGDRAAGGVALEESSRQKLPLEGGRALPRS